jgi:hypothetical protein
MSINHNPADPASDKLAVVEAIYRYAAGIDLRDRALLSSALAEDAVSDFRPAAAKAGFDYPVLQGRETIVEALSSSLAQLDTTHSASNPRVTLNGDTAQLDVLIEAQHHPRQDHARHYLMKNVYKVALARIDATWVIKHITVDNFWRDGDPSVLAGV